MFINRQVLRPVLFLMFCGALLVKPQLTAAQPGNPIPSLDNRPTNELVEMLRNKNENRGLRGAATLALARKGQEAVAPLVELLSHPDQETRLYALTALQRIDSPEAKKAVEDFNTKRMLDAAQAKP